jgi:hypothetical protein
LRWRSVGVSLPCRSRRCSISKRFLDQAGSSASARLESLESTAKARSLLTSFLKLGASVPSDGRFTFERKLLLDQALISLPKIAALPVDGTVKQLFCKGFAAAGYGKHLPNEFTIPARDGELSACRSSRSSLGGLTIIEMRFALLNHLASADEYRRLWRCCRPTLPNLFPLTEFARY